MMARTHLSDERTSIIDNAAPTQLDIKGMKIPGERDEISVAWNRADYTPYLGQTVDHILCSTCGHTFVK